jgi:hypothetical protein
MLNKSVLFARRRGTSVRFFSTQALLKSLEKKVTIETDELQELLDAKMDDLAVLNSTILRRNYDPY